MIVNDLIGSLGIDMIILVYLILPVLCLLFFSYLCIYRTETLLKYLKIETPLNRELVDEIQFEEEKKSLLSKEAVYDIGVFLIGFYLLVTNLPNVVLRIVQWFTKELSQVKGNSLDDLLNMVSPYHTDTLLYSLLYAVSGYLIVVNHSKITAYFLNKKETI